MKAILALLLLALPALAADVAVGVDSRIEGLEASDTTQLIYSTQDHVTPQYVRSATCWAADINLTCVSPWNSGNAHLWAGTAITPRHIAHAQHAFVADGSTIRFITMDGTVVERTVSSGMQIGTTDLRISLLSADLPATITPAKVLPDNWELYMDEIRAPVLLFNQEERVSVADILHIRPGGGALGSDIQIQIPVDAQRLEFHVERVGGDSGNPVFLIVGNEPVLLFCFQTSVWGTTLIEDNRAAVAAAIETLGAFGHSLQSFEFPVSTITADTLNVTNLIIGQ